ncbi:MAG TPA: VOC family protein [Bryobacteraceae bacterium]|nr:VOC family protein [Bryobacteraceae bacterium]
MNRREALGLVAGSLAARAFAQSAGPLPLNTTGLEHLGMTVPDQKASAEFYGRIFDPQLFQEKDPPPRFYVRLGTAYLAFGGTATPGAPAKIDHFCALVKDYKPDEVRAAVEQAGGTMGSGRLGMPTDADGLRLQLLGVPGGLARTIVPSTRITTDDAALQAIGLNHIVLTVSDLDKASAYYAKFFGAPVSRSRKPERIWFGVAHTRLALEPVASGSKPAIERVSVKVAGFERRGIIGKLKKVGVETVATGDGNAVRFKDPNGFTIELTGAA